VTTFNLSPSEEGEGAVLTHSFSETPVVADAAERGAARFSHLPLVPVIALVEGLDAMQLHRTVPMR
jgi:hypothetical protein